MPLGNLDLEFDGTRLVHLSDLHHGTLVREKHLHRYVEIVNSLEADFVAITGDFITTSARQHARAVAGVLPDLRVNKAVVACLGNHDYGRWPPRVGVGPMAAEKRRPRIRSGPGNRPICHQRG